MLYPFRRAVSLKPQSIQEFNITSVGWITQETPQKAYWTLVSFSPLPQPNYVGGLEWFFGYADTSTSLVQAVGLPTPSGTICAAHGQQACLGPLLVAPDETLFMAATAVAGMQSLSLPQPPITGLLWGVLTDNPDVDLPALAAASAGISSLAEVTTGQRVTILNSSVPVNNVPPTGGLTTIAFDGSVNAGSTSTILNGTPGESIVVWDATIQLHNSIVGNWQLYVEDTSGNRFASLRHNVQTLVGQIIGPVHPLHFTYGVKLAAGAGIRLNNNAGSTGSVLACGMIHYTLSP